MKILFAGGGSVGHIAPSVSIWETLHKRYPNAQAHFVCSPRPDDAAFLKNHHLAYTILDAPRLSLWFPLQWLQACAKARNILNDVKPDAIFCKGGYVSLPIAYVAKQKKIPMVMHESDSVSGYANRIVRKWAKAVCTGFPTNKNQYYFTGNPIRTDVTQGSKQEAQRITGFDGSKPVLLVTGGSQGAAALNAAIANQLDDLLLRCDIIHITGRGKALNVPNTHHYYQTEFANEELAHFYALASVALSRAGAGSIGELAANSIPTILVPLRGVGHDHQYQNALVATNTGGCIHLEQEELDAKLLPTVHDIVTHTEKQRDMSTNIQALYKPDASVQIAEIILQCLDSAPRDA